MDDNDNFEEKPTNWPGAVAGVAFLIFLLLLCFGNRLLDWLGAPPS